MSLFHDDSKTVFPPPPPTVNTLTHHQRTQLQRTTRKLARVLGTTPRLVDVDVNMSTALGQLHVRLPASPSSSSSISSGSSTWSPGHSRSPSRCSIDSINSQFRLPASTLPSRSNGGRSSHRSPPLLRLAAASRHSSPPPPKSTAKYYTDDSNTLYIPTARPSSVAYAFTISDTRREKMARLARKLGEGVPMGLVFPESSLAEDTLTVDLPPPPPTPRTPRSRGIAAARDSLSIEAPSPHRATRKSKRVAVPPLSASAHAASVPSQLSPVSESFPSLPSKTRSSYVTLDAVLEASSYGRRSGMLSAIIESPDEHGYGWQEGFGFRRGARVGRSISASSSSGSSRAVSSSPSFFSSSPASSASSLELLFDECEGEECMEREARQWSTRRGYPGWKRPAEVDY